MAFINLQLPWTAQLRLLQVYLPAAQTLQHWATEAQAEKSLFCLSECPQDRPAGWDTGTGRKRCYKCRRHHRCLRSCREGLPFFSSTIHHICYSSGIITIVITTEYFHSINVTKFASKCIALVAALLFDTSPQHLHISTRGYRLFPWHHSWKETAVSHSINLYWFIQ